MQRHGLIVRKLCDRFPEPWAPQKTAVCSAKGMGTRTLGMCSADKTLRDRVGGEGWVKGPKEARVEVPADWKKRVRQGLEAQPVLVDSEQAVDRTRQSPEASSTFSSSVRMEERSLGRQVDWEPERGSTRARRRMLRLD